MSDNPNIKKFRKALDWTQDDLAKALGVNRATVSRMENGQKPSGAVMKLLKQIMAKHPKAAE